MTFNFGAIVSNVHTFTSVGSLQVPILHMRNRAVKKMIFSQNLAQWRSN